MLVQRFRCYTSFVRIYPYAFANVFMLVFDNVVNDASYVGFICSLSSFRPHKTMQKGNREGSGSCVACNISR